MVLSAWKRERFLKHESLWSPFLHAASKLDLKFSFESMIVPRYLEHQTHSTMEPLMDVVACAWVHGHIFCQNHRWVGRGWSRDPEDSSADFKMSLFFQACSDTFVHRINSKGESTHPRLDRVPCTRTLWLLLVKKSRIQPTRFLFMPNCSKSHLIKIRAWTVSKAER